MKVVKKNGTSENMMFDKVTVRIKNLLYDLNENISAEEVAQKVLSSMYDGISTHLIDDLTAEICVARMTDEPDYETLATRVVVSRLHKIVPSTFYDCMKKLFDDGQIHTDVWTFVADNKDVLDSAIDISNDFNFNYFGFKTLEKAYLKRVSETIVESPQYMYMRVSCGIHQSNVIKAVETYKYMSKGMFIHATPTLFNAGTPRPQLSSCFLMAMKEDSIKGIFDTVQNCAHISKWAGGIGLHIHNVRGNKSVIKGTNGVSDGIIPMLRVFNATARYVNQAGKRKGSFAIYLEPHHVDIMEFLELRLNQGDEESRTRDLFTALWIPDLFMERVKSDGSWSLFCPNRLKLAHPELPSLADVYGDRFNELYIQFENEGLATKTVKAADVWKAIIKSQSETGTPYMLYKDACNEKSNQKNIGTIKSSNLCTEIIEYSDPDETAVCNLASIALPKFVENKKFNYKELHKVARIVTHNLNNVIDVTYYPIPEARTSNLRHRPIGIGVQGLADVFMMCDIPFDSEEASDMNAAIFETIYHGALTESCELATVGGPYKTFKGSPASQGLFQQDLWVNPKMSFKWDWMALRDKVVAKGLRNSLLVAPMPTASTSQILGNNECFEPYTTNIYLRRTLAGEFVVINKHLVNKLKELNMWTKEVKDHMIVAGGSIQNIEGIPQETKNVYKTVWEISQKKLIDMARDRGCFIDQSQSLNLFMENPTMSKISSMHMYAWNSGLKTGIYYLRTKAKARPIQVTVDPTVCTSCSA